MQCPVDFVGVPLINLLGSVIGRKVGIRLKQFDNWTEFANLWGILVARPGKKKSPAMDEVLSFQGRLVASYEKLADLHVANPNGLMVQQDEMIALMRKLDNPDNADWRAFALTGWGGKSSHTVDRIGRGTQTIPHVCLSLFGATQPERIAAYVRPAITGAADDDGLCQRFQMTVWPDTDKPWVRRPVAG